MIIGLFLVLNIEPPPPLPSQQELHRAKPVASGHPGMEAGVEPLLSLLPSLGLEGLQITSLLLQEVHRTPEMAASNLPTLLRPRRYQSR